MKPLTEPEVADSLDREYYNMPYHNTKPCIHVRFPWEDHRKRMYIQNMMTKCVNSLVSETWELIYEFKKPKIVTFILKKFWLSKTNPIWAQEVS